MLKRFLVAVPFAAAVTVGIFYSMSALTGMPAGQLPVGHGPEGKLAGEIKGDKPAPTSLLSAPQPPADGAARAIVRPLPQNSCGRGDDKVVLDFTVDADGFVSDVKVVSASSSCFADAAMRAVLGWRYRPRVVGGRPVRSRVRETVHFRPPEAQGPVEHWPIEHFRSPKVLVRLAPPYPACGRGDGEVRLQFVVETDGSVGDIEVISATSPCFAKAARRALRNCRYRPTIKDGQPVRSDPKRVTIQFKHGDSMGTVLQ